MVRRNPATTAVAGIAVATVAAALLAGNYLFTLDDSLALPFVLLAREPFAWIVVAALVVAALGHTYIE